MQVSLLTQIHYMVTMHSTIGTHIAELVLVGGQMYSHDRNDCHVQ